MIILRKIPLVLFSFLLAGAACAADGVNLRGAAEVPPVSTKATGKSMIQVASDRTVSGSVTTSGMTPTAAHIHEGASGVSGPAIVPLTKAADNSFTVPPNTRLSEAQYASYQAGNLYVNVHSAAYPDGEIRAQLTAPPQK